MWKRLNVNMSTGKISEQVIPPEKRLGGRALIAHILNHEMDPKADPLSEKNVIIICNGLLAGTTASTAGRLSVGTKSPLTGYIKESNAGGGAGRALASLGIRCLVITGKAPESELQILVVSKGQASLLPAVELQGVKTYAACQALRKRFGDKAAILCAGPAAEQLSSMASLQATDMFGKPTRSCGQGGTGAVLVSKGLKAVILIENPNYTPDIFDRQTFTQAARNFAKCLNEDIVASNSLQNNTTATQTDPSLTDDVCANSFKELAKLATKHVQSMQGKEKKHRQSCQPGCLIQCANQDKKTEHKTTEIEHKNSSFFGDGLGIDDQEKLDSISRACDEIGVDAIETGQVLRLAIQAGNIALGDAAGVMQLLEEIALGTPRGKELGLGMQGFAETRSLAYTPDMQNSSVAWHEHPLNSTAMLHNTTSQDTPPYHTNDFDRYTLNPKKHSSFTQVKPSTTPLTMQQQIAMMDSTGLCLFACMALDNPKTMQSMVSMLNALDNSAWTAERLAKVGVDCLQNEYNFNKKAGC